MNIKQKKALREANILYSGREITRESGLPQLRMPELAKKAEVSIGSLYRHYECREDVITVLARQALEFRTAKLSQYCASISDDQQRLYALIILDFLFNVVHPEAFHSELTCDNPQWWKSVSPQEKEEYQRASVCIAAEVQKIVRQALPNKDDTGITLIATGIWSLITGISNIWLIQNKQQNASDSLTDSIGFFTPHLIAFIQGYCPDAGLSKCQLSELFKKITEDQPLWLWPHVKPGQPG